MSEEAISVEEEKEEENTTSCTNTMSRKEKRKEMKKKKRKQKRKEMAEKEMEEVEAKLNDPEEKRKADLMEQEERERVERERKEFEERERVWVEEMMEKNRKDEEEEEEERRKRHALEEEEKDKIEDESDWEYVEEGPAEIIWQGNEIIVKKKKVKVPKKKAEQRTIEEDADRPTSNPLPPQSEAFLDYKNVSTVSTQEIYDNVAQQVPNFGTELDKAHCPFHIKTGVCRFGQRCSRVHFYPDKSCTLLIKNMYNGPGLAWEQDEGLEFTDEEIERCYEEFYEDVHTEFLKFGELVNFKVCKNGSFHLRGNVYVHYKSLDSAVLACHSLNGRYFAGKQVKFEFVGVTKWKVAICGEYMKSRLKTCSHGTACNFIHCFRNPGGDYEWADWDKPPPKYWVTKMVALFGHSDEFEYENQVEHESFGQLRSSSRMITADEDRYRSRRSKSRETDGLNRGSGRSHYDKNDARKSKNRHMRKSNDRKRIKVMDDFEYEERTNFRDSHHKNRTHDTDSDGDLSIRDRDRDRDRNRHHGSARGSSRQHNKVLKFTSDNGDNGNDGHRRKRTNNADSGGYWSDGDGESRKHHDHGIKLSETSSNNGDSEHQISEADPDRGWSDADRNRDKYQGQRKKSSRHWHKAPGVLDDCGGRRKRTHETDSGGDWSEGHRDSKNHNGHRGKSSRDQNNSPGHAEVKGDDKNSNLYSDSSGDWSGKNRENCRTRKRLRNSSQVAEVSDDRWDPE